MSKAFYFFFIVLCALSCNQSDDSHVSKTIFRYNQASGIGSLDPAFAKDQANIWAVNQLFNGLVQMSDVLRVEPCIAKSWDIEDGGTIYTFHLRTDIYFHDHELFPNGKGRKVVAQDFVYSFQRIIDPKIASPGAWIFNDKVGRKRDFIAVNDSTFQVKLIKPFQPFLELLTMQYCSVVPKEIVEHYAKEFRRNPIGTGPFELKHWEEGVKLLMVKNDRYFEYKNNKQLPFLDAINVSFISDKQTAFLEFVKGNLDFYSGIDRSFKDDLLTKEGKLQDKYKGILRMETMPYLNTEYLGFLVDDALVSGPTSMKKIRQAIAYAVDREKMITYLRNNIATPAFSGFVPKGLPSFSDQQVKGYTYNPEKSRTLLKEAGFPGGKGLPEITLHTNKSYLDLCEFMQNQLAEVGINIKLEVLPPATQRELMAQGKLNFFRGSWIADYADAENYLALFYSKNKSPKGPNYTHFENEQYDQLYEKSKLERERVKRYEYYSKMDQIIMEEAVVIVLYYDQIIRLTHPNVIGLRNNAMNLLTLKEVRIEKGKAAN